MDDMAKIPSWVTVVVAGWVGFMFATAVAAVIPSLRLWAAPILCHAPYNHGVVEVHNFSYGFTSGYSLDLRCANAAHQEHGTSGLAVIGILWIYGWIAALLVRGVYYWGKFLVRTGWKTIDARRAPPPPVPRQRPRIATPASLLGDSARPRLRPPPPVLTFAERMRAANPQSSTAGRSDPVDQLARLAELHDRGALTDAEFAAEKSKIIGT
jgi:hypothetical protein